MQVNFNLNYDYSNLILKNMFVVHFNNLFLDKLQDVEEMKKSINQFLKRVLEIFISVNFKTTIEIPWSQYDPQNPKRWFSEILIYRNLNYYGSLKNQWLVLTRSHCPSFKTHTLVFQIWFLVMEKTRDFVKPFCWVYKFMWGFCGHWELVLEICSAMLEACSPGFGNCLLGFCKSYYLGWEIPRGFL